MADQIDFTPDQPKIDFQPEAKPTSLVGDIGKAVGRTLVGIPKGIAETFLPPESGFQEVKRTFQGLSEIVHGKPLKEVEEQYFPEARTIPSLFDPNVPREQKIEAGLGVGLQVGSVLLPFLKGAKIKLGETVFGKRPTEPAPITQPGERGFVLQPEQAEAPEAQQAAAEVQPKGGEIPSATKEGQVEPDTIGEHPGDDTGGTPTGPSEGGGVPTATTGEAEAVGRVDVMKLAEEQQAGKAGETVEEIKGKEDDAKGQGEKGRVLEPAAAETPPAPAAVPLETTSTEPTVSGIANRISAEKVARGEVGEIVPGQGHSVNELRQGGQGMSPEEINQHVSDVMSGTGDIVKQGQALTAEEARLSQRSNQLSREADADPTNMEKKLAADNAFKDLTDFYNGPIATLKTRWSDAGKTLQGEIPVDLSTFNGMREAWLKDTGKVPPPEVEPMLRDVAKKVTGANGEADASIGRLGQSIDQATKGRKIPPPEQIRNNILERLKGRAPCN